MNRSRLPAKGLSSPPEFFSSHVSEARRFYLELAPPEGGSLAVVCGGCEHCAPDYSIHRATFPYYSIEWVAQGGGTLVLQGRSHALQTGGVFSYGPGIAQDIVTDPARPLVKYFVDFAGRQAEALLRSCQLPPGSAARLFAVEEIQVLFDELIRHGGRGTRYSPEICVRLLECLALKIAESRAPEAGTEALSFQTYQRCRQYLRQHFARLKTIEDLARECHVNAAYLCRLFRRYDHQSPYQCLLRLKMRHAAELMRQPGVLIKQVAEAAGFDDPFHFSRSFKSVFGLSPDAFRRLR